MADLVQRHVLPESSPAEAVVGVIGPHDRFRVHAKIVHATREQSSTLS